MTAKSASYRLQIWSSVSTLKAYNTSILRVCDGCHKFDCPSLWKIPFREKNIP